MTAQGDKPAGAPKTQEVRYKVLAVEAGPTLTELVKSYNISCQVWPEYLFVDGERRQTGFELELLGSHCSDSHHFDLTCSMCKRVLATLRAIAGSIVPRSDNSVRYEIDAHAQSIVLLPRLQNRSFVTLSIRISHSQGFDQPIDAYQINCLNEIKGHLQRVGVRER